jgi:hypothetical protein
MSRIVIGVDEVTLGIASLESPLTLFLITVVIGTDEVNLSLFDKF